MDEQRAWLKARRKRRLRILAVMLSVCVLFTTYPDIPATLSVFASEEQAEGRYISGFTALSDEIREQTVPVGTELTELSLPDTLEAVVTEQPSEEGGPSDSGQENTEENKDTDAGEETGDEQDTQPEKDGESEETDGKADAGDEDTADTEEEENTEESAPSEEQQESAVSQETHTVTMQEYLAENVISVQTLENTQTESAEEEAETVTIDGVTWQSEPEYDGSAEGIYIFTAVLPEGYALAEGVRLPQIHVTVEQVNGKPRRAAARAAAATDWGGTGVREVLVGIVSIWGYGNNLTITQGSTADTTKLYYTGSPEPIDLSPAEGSVKDGFHTERCELCTTGGQDDYSSYDVVTHMSGGILERIWNLKSDAGSPRSQQVFMSGGTLLTENTAIAAHVVDISGDSAIKGSVSIFGSLSVSGSPQIGGEGKGIRISSGTMFTVKGILSNASIYVNPQADFADGTKVAQAASGYTITESDLAQMTLTGSYVEGKELYLENNAIYIRVKPEVPHTVTYNYSANGGTSTTKTSDTVIEGAAADLTPTATKGGWEFVGWNTEQNAHEGLTTLTMGEEDVTLHAIYKKTLTASFYSSSAGAKETVSTTIYNKATTGTVKAPAMKAWAMAAESGYTAWHWSDGKFSGTAVNPGSTVSLSSSAGDVSYYGLYQKSITVSYDANDGTGSAASQITTRLASVHEQVAYQTSPSVTLHDGTGFRREGYTFNGWIAGSKTGTDLVAAGTSVSPTQDITYYASWKPNTYTVTLQPNGGTGTALTGYTYGTGAALPTDWAKTGYDFAGWYDNENCTGDPVTEISATDTGNKTFWAKWTPKTYQVTFHYHGADGGDATASQNVTYNSKYGILPVPTRTGYTFRGWYTEAEGKGTEVNAGTTVTTAFAHTLHAHWKDETPPNQPVLQDGVTLPAGWTNTQDKIPLKLYDGVRVVKLLVSIDGSQTYEEVSGFSNNEAGSVNYEYKVQSGEHTYQFKAVDAAGNVSVASALFTVKLDQTKPVIGTLTYDDAVHTNLWHWIIGKKSMVVHVPVTDTGSGVTEISYTRTDKDAAGNLDTGSAVTDTATVTNGEAKITIAADFRGTIAISCTDRVGNAADSVTIGADAGGVIVEDTPPDITILADRNISDTQQTQPSGVDVSEGYYNSAPALLVTVKDDTGNAITAGIATVKYKVGDGTERSVAVNTNALQEEVTFTIPASKIPPGITEITVTATDNAGNTATKPITVKVKGPEKTPAAVIDYRQEELTGLVPGGSYTIDGTAYTADQEGHIAIKEDWLGSSISIVKKGNGSETTDSTAQTLSIPARPAAPGAPELRTRTENSITLNPITGAQYRLADGTDNWQDSTAFTGLAQKTIYRFRAYYPATDTSFASRESGEAQIATMPTAPTEDKLRIGYVAETFTLTDGIEAFVDAGCTSSVTAGSVTAYMGQTVYIRYPENGSIPASLTTPVPIPARPAKPAPGTEDASYPAATDGAITDLTPGTTYEYRVKDTDGKFGAWKTATPNGTKIENLPAGDYEVRVKAVETGNTSFQSEAAAVTIGATPATKYETPKIRIDHPAETLTGFVPGAEYTIGSDTITAGADGTLPIKKEWFGTTLSITRNGNDKDKLDSDPRSLPVPARPAKPTPTGVDVSTAGGTGKLTGLTAGTAYEVSTDGGKTWASHTADESGQITGLLPGTYVVRVKASTDHFAGEPSDAVKIGAYQVKVAFMVDGTKYREIPVDYGAALTDIPPVPAKDNATGAWCMDEQGTTPAVFTNITADMTVYAVYTTTYTVTLQTGTGYTLSAQPDSESPVKEGGSFTFRFALADGYQRNANFAVKVNGVKVELTAQEPYTYTITDIRENKTVTVEGVGKKPGGKPADGGDKGDDPKPEPEDPTPRPDDQTPENPAPKPPVTPPAKPTSPAPAPGETSPAGKQPEGRPGSRPEREENGAQNESGEPEKEWKPEDTDVQDAGTDGTDAGTPKPDGTDSGQSTGGTPAKQAEVKIGNGTVIVTVVCEEEKCTATVADTEKVVEAVLTPHQQALVSGGETIEIRIDVTDISEKVPAQDKEVIENGIGAYREEVPGLVLGMYVDISMFIKLGAGDWNAITETDEPIEVVVNIPEKLLSDNRKFIIIRSHNGEYTFMNDMDEAPETITVSTDRFSSYAIAYAETDGTGADSGAKCGLCHICPTFLGICYFIWLAVVIVLALMICFIIWRKKGQEEEKQEK